MLVRVGRASEATKCVPTVIAGRISRSIPPHPEVSSHPSSRREDEGHDAEGDEGGMQELAGDVLQHRPTLASDRGGRPPPT